MDVQHAPPPHPTRRRLETRSRLAILAKAWIALGWACVGLAGLSSLLAVALLFVGRGSDGRAAFLHFATGAFAFVFGWLACWTIGYLVRARLES